MKLLKIELSDEQHSKMMAHLQKGTANNIEKSCLSGYSFHLLCLDGGIYSWMEVEMNGRLDLGEVDWKMSEK